MSWSRLPHVAALLASLVLVAGCPDDQAAPPPPPQTPSGPAPITPSAPPTPAPVVTGTGDPTPAEVGETAPTLVTVTPPEPPALGERVRLGSGHLLTATSDLRVGGAGVRDGLAQLEVLIGAFCYSVEAAPGDVVAVGPALLAVDEVEAASPGAAFVRWEREAPPGAPLLLEPKADAQGLLLREQALFGVGDQARVGVGNVRDTPEGPRVTLTIFPSDYAADPGVGYARDLRVAQGALVGVGGPGPKFRVARVSPRGGGQRWGTVVLAPP